MGRKRGSRFRKALDAQEQLEGIEWEQRAARQRKVRKVIGSTEKSRQRNRNALRNVRRPEDAPAEFEY